MLFHRSGFNYINKKKSNADKIIKGYKNYCADLIESTYLSYRIRNRLKPIRDLISNKKKIISKYAIAYRTRLILRSSSIQNILIEIANIKSALNSKDSSNDNLNEQFKQRLDKLYLNFIDEYNCLKSNKSWVDQSKSENPWLIKYLSLIYVNNPKYNIDNQIKKIKDNFNKSKSKGVINFDNDNNKNNNNFNSYDERPIKPMKLTGFNMEDAYPKEGEEIPKKRIVRNKKNNTNNNNNNNNNLNNGDINNENLNNDNFENNNNENLNNQNNFNNYDERPIGSKKINYEEMFGNPNEKFDEEDPNKFTKKEIKKKIPNNRNVNKKPKYDARKAIEEAKQKELKEGKKEKKSSFREFIREMKKIAKEEKDSKKNLDSQMSNFGNSQSQIKDSIKNNTTSNINFSNLNEGSDKKIKKDNNNNNNINEVKDERQSRKNQPIEIELRRKLHDLERSPPPKLNIKNAKSKINCWANTDKNTVNIRTFSKGKNKINNQKNDWKRIITDKQNLNKIESECNKISNAFNIDNFFKEKEDKMKEFDQIPFIKKKQNYIESLTDEAYNQLLIQLNNKYKDLNE